jgi:hypothetical protein
VQDLALQAVISEKKVQDPEKEVLMVAERRFCPFESQTASWRGRHRGMNSSGVADIDDITAEAPKDILSR